MKRFFLSRVTILCLILAALAAITLAAFIPQGFTATPEEMMKWQEAHRRLRPWADLLGLHRLYTHPLFALVLAGVTLSLCLSAWNQCVTAWRRTFSPCQPESGEDRFTSSMPLEAMGRLLRRCGYLRLNDDKGSLRMVRHPWGFWGLALFHVGMLLAIAASLLIALTQQRGAMQITRGDVELPEVPLLAGEQGMLVGPLKLPEAIRLDRVTWRFRANNDGVESVASALTFISGSGREEARTVEVNHILGHRGLNYYQGLEFGHAFLVEISDPTGRVERLQLQLQHPKTPSQASYQVFKETLGNGDVLRVKYVVNEEMKSFDKVDPLLTLRIDRHEKEIGRLPLKEQGEGSIGSYRFKVHAVVPWARFIVVRITGLPGVFIGFFILCLGGLLHYFAPPREITICEKAGGVYDITWRAVRFTELYRAEYEELKGLLHG